MKRSKYSLLVAVAALASVSTLLRLLVWAHYRNNIQVNAPTSVVQTTPLFMQFSPDDRLLVTGNEYKQARIWDVTAGVLTRSLTLGEGNPIAAAFSPDGHQLAIAEAQGSVGIWDTLTWQLTQQIKHAFSPPSRLLRFTFQKDALIVTDQDAQRQWSVASGQLLHTEPLQAKGAKWDSLSADGKLSVSRGKHGDAILTNLRAGTSTPFSVGLESRSIRSLAWGNSYQRSNRLSDIAFSPDSTLLAVGSAMGRGKLWQVTNHDKLAAFEAYSVAFTQDSKVLATGTNMGEVALRNAGTGRPLVTLHCGGGRLQQSSVRLLKFAPDGKYLAVAINDVVQVWNVSMKATRLSSLR